MVRRSPHRVLRASTLRYELLQNKTAAARDFVAKQGSELCKPETTEIFATARAYGQGAPLDFPVAGDQEERDTFNCVLADFKAYLLIPQVRFYPKPLISQVFRNFQAIFLLSFGNSHHHGLDRSQPGRQFAGMVFDQNPDKSLQRPKHRPVQHDRGVLLAVFADVGRAEAPREVELHLQGAALAIAPNGISQDELQLRSIERPFPGVQRGFDAGRRRRLAQRRFGLVPDLVRAHPLRRPIRELDPHIVEAEIAVTTQDELADLDRLRTDLVRRAKNTSVVL